MDRTGGDAEEFGELRSGQFPHRWVAGSADAAQPHCRRDEEGDTREDGPSHAETAGPS